MTLKHYLDKPSYYNTPEDDFNAIANSTNMTTTNIKNDNVPEDTLRSQSIVGTNFALELAMMEEPSDNTSKVKIS